MEAAGITVSPSPSELGKTLKELLATASAGMERRRRNYRTRGRPELGAAELAGDRARRAQPRARPDPGDDRESQGGGRARRPRPTGADPDDDPPRRRGQHPRDDADPHLSRARAPRRRPRPARPDRARRAGRPHARLSRLHRRRPRPADLDLRRARLRAGDGAPDRRGCFSRPTAATSASNICTSTTSRSGASSRTGSRARTRRPVHARGQAVDPDQGHPRRAVGEIPRPQICRAPSASGSTAAKARSRRSRR